MRHELHPARRTYERRAYGDNQELFENVPVVRGRSADRDRDTPSGVEWRGAPPASGRFGRFRGVGPRGYVRRDERIREDACECLTLDPELDATEIEVQVRDGEVVLEGTVGERWIKRRAELLCADLPGVRDVQNRIRVRRRAPLSGERPSIEFDAAATAEHFPGAASLAPVPASLPPSGGLITTGSVFTR